MLRFAIFTLGLLLSAKALQQSPWQGSAPHQVRLDEHVSRSMIQLSELPPPLAELRLALEGKKTLQETPRNSSARMTSAGSPANVGFMEGKSCPPSTSAEANHPWMTRIHLGPPSPPKCPPSPPRRTNVGNAFAPNRPQGAVGESVRLHDGGLLWPLEDGGWAFQYDDVAVHMDSTGAGASIVWRNETAYFVEYDQDHLVYHTGDRAVHQKTNGATVFHQPSGTVHQEDNVLIYHWCHPNVVVYQTPSGVTYHDDTGITYQGLSGIVHYAMDGSVKYHGVGGVTFDDPFGRITHWTPSGIVYYSPGQTTYFTEVGHCDSKVLPLVPLGEEPFPGAPLTEDEILALTSPEHEPGASPRAT